MPPSYLRYYHQPGKRARYPWFSRLLVRFGTLLTFLYMLSSVFAMSRIESVFNGGFAYSMKLMWLPMAILFAATTWFCCGEFAKVNKSRIKPWLLAALAYPLFLFSSWPFVMVWNALGTAKTQVTYAGPVIKKSTNRGRYGTSYNVTISDRYTQTPVTLKTSNHRFETLSRGDPIQETFYVGRLGLPYRWRSFGNE